MGEKSAKIVSVHTKHIRQVQIKVYVLNFFFFQDTIGYGEPGHLLLGSLIPNNESTIYMRKQGRWAPSTARTIEVQKMVGGGGGVDDYRRRQSGSVFKYLIPPCKLL